MNSPEDDDLENQIAQLETRTAALKSRRKVQVPRESAQLGSKLDQFRLHVLLLLSDSALPLGSFAFSSGLESCLAHHKQKRTSPTRSDILDRFHTFLQLTVESVAGTSLPFLLAAYHEPEKLHEWDEGFDVATVCNVARRASVSQGKGLLGVWEKSFSSTHISSSAHDVASAALGKLSQDLKRVGQSKTDVHQRWALQPSGHYAPLWGILTRIMGLSAEDSVYLFLFSHVRTVVSAAVRASVLGPYQAQAVLSSERTQLLIREIKDQWWRRGIEDVGQIVPVMDLWMGRHEILYSRIFNS